jgi:uncharacterized membrane protein YgcG
MKCKFCSFSTSDKKAMVSHIKNNHRNQVIKESGRFQSTNEDDVTSLISDTMFLNLIDDIVESSSSSYDNFSGGGGEFLGGGASGDFSSDDDN